MEPPSWQQTAGKAIREQMVFLKSKLAGDGYALNVSLV